MISHDKQKVNEGYGPVYHRVYSIDLPISLDEARAAMLDLQKDINQFSPQILAHFEKLKGSEGTLKVQDEFQIHITGPWNGPVTVTHCDSDTFCLHTLKGHMEAGEIHFRIKKKTDGKIVFEIESIARSRDALVDLVYDKIPVAKLVQEEMWTYFCRKFAEHAVAHSSTPVHILKIGDVEVLTEKRNENSGQWELA